MVTAIVGACGKKAHGQVRGQLQMRHHRLEILSAGTQTVQPDDAGADWLGRCFMYADFQSCQTFPLPCSVSLCLQCPLGYGVRRRAGAPFMITACASLGSNRMAGDHKRLIAIDLDKDSAFVAVFSRLAAGGACALQDTAKTSVLSGFPPVTVLPPCWLWALMPICTRHNPALKSAARQVA